MKIQKEKPFEYLRRKDDGKLFGEEIVKNWYLARAYVLDKLKGIAFKPSSDEHLHVVVNGDNAMMLFVVRQVALFAHYINFDEAQEEAYRNRTVISIVSQNPDIKGELEKEEYLCNLPKYCKFVDNNFTKTNSDSHIDIEIHIVKDCPKDEGGNILFIRQEEVDVFFENHSNDNDYLSIDTRKAVYASRIYGLGGEIDNLPAEDIHCAKRYALAMNVYLHQILKKKPGMLVDEENWKDQSIVKENLSNIFCADCFESRNLCIQQCWDGSVGKKKMWEQHNEALSKSEHARWVVEKLIMGYSPLNAQQRYKDESLFYDKKAKGQYRKSLKRNAENPVHIDLCSYADLRRINPNDLKYDSFLMLAIPKILERVS
jgi:hypothetical protein